MFSHRSVCMRYFTVRAAGAPRRDVSIINNVATRTSISLRQRGQRGVRVLPDTPSRYESEVPQCGHG